jgi:lysophospholipase L1-like esterase
MGILDAPVPIAALRGLSLPRQSMAFIGDSIIYNGGETVTDTNRTSRGIQHWAFTILNGRLRLLGSFGVSGETLVQIAARIATPLALNPGFLVIEGGTNDVAASATAATIQATWLSMIITCLRAGVVPVILNIPPRTNATSGQNLVRAAANDWLAAYGAANPGVIVVDAYRRVVAINDANHSNWASNLSIDHIHPAAPGAAFIGKAVADALAPFAWGPKPVKNRYDETNKTTAVFFSVGAGLETGWTNTNQSGDVPTFTKVRSKDTGAPWQQVVNTAGSQNYILQWTSMATVGLAVGDRIQALVEFESDDDWELDGTTSLPKNKFSLDIHAISAAPANLSPTYSSMSRLTEGFGYNPRSGVLETPIFTIPATAASIEMTLVFGYGGTIRWRHPTIVKLP